MSFGEIFGFLKEALKIFNLFNSDEKKKESLQNKAQKKQDEIEKDLKEGKHENIVNHLD